VQNWTAGAGVDVILDLLGATTCRQISMRSLRAAG
jgi:NADPH:quinone reductase-like Zn-dependent oxidoreductase